MKLLTKSHQNAKILLKVHDMNPIDLYNAMKESEDFGLSYKRNSFKTTLEEEKLISKIKELNRTKCDFKVKKEENVNYKSVKIEYCKLLNLKICTVEL